jgi:lipopolysaccharide transport system permease protein
MIPERYRMFLFLNPFAPLIISWQKLFMQNAFSTQMILAALIWAVVIFLFGFIIYKNLESKFAEVI